MPKITKATITGATPGAKDIWVWDSELPGFGVRVTPAGRKVFVARYRTSDGLQRKTNIGRCTDLTPEKARDLARKMFGQVAEGKDPKAEQRDAKAAPTITQLEERYTREHAKPFKAESSNKSDETNWRLYILPALGKAKIKDVGHGDVLALVGSLSAKPSTANQCLALLSKAFSLAEIWKMREANSNPCRGVKKYKITEKELILTHEQLAALNRTLTDMADSQKIQPEFAAFIRLLMLTGCRKNEIMHAKKAWIDRERSLLLLPTSKTGQRRIALSPAALEVIDTLGADGEWLIPGRCAGEPLQAPYKTWSAIKAQAGLPDELRLHDLRHSAGSLAHMAGATQLEVAKMLGHKQLSTTERYLHGFVGANAKTVNTVSDVITKAWGEPAKNVNLLQ